MKIEFPRQIFRKILKFHENPSSGCKVVPCRRTDRHDEANSRFSAILRARLHKRATYGKLPKRIALIIQWRKDKLSTKEEEC